MTRPHTQTAPHCAIRLFMVAALAVSVLAGLQIAAPATTEAASQVTSKTYYVAPNGNDGNPGSKTRPFRTFTYAMQQLRPGDNLFARGGTYVEKAHLRGSALTPGYPGARINVRAYPGERPIIKGMFWLSNADYYTIDGINVTWDPAVNTSQDVLMRFYGGKGWILRNGELWGAKGYSALLIFAGASDWNVNRMYIRDTMPANGYAQDHLIYVKDTTNGMIEYNLLVNSPNGRGVKLGQHFDGSLLPKNVTVRYNTIVNSGAGNISFSYDANYNRAIGNILVNPGTDWETFATYYVSGVGNSVSSNVYWGSDGLVLPGTLIKDAGGNRNIDPMLNSNFKPTNAALKDANGIIQYGHYRGQR